MPSAKPSWICALLVLAALAGSGLADAEDAAAPVASRIVSMNPSLTETLLALGVGDRLVGVDEYSARQQPEVRELPVVGGLFSPSLEAVTALAPDLVVLVPSAQQRSFRDRVEALGVRVLALPNITLEELLASIDVLGVAVGRGSEARALVEEIRGSLAEARRATVSKPRVRALLVLQRDPLYVVGGANFIDSMLTAAGANNVAGVFDEPYPRVAVEWVVDRAPDVILDASDDPLPAKEYWSRWPSLPAVSNGRVTAVSASEVTRPGPYLGQAVRSLARALHGSPAFDASRGPAARVDASREAP